MVTTMAPATVDFKHVVIASDFGDEANRALAYAKSIVRASDGELLLIHVGTPVAYIAIPEGAWVDDPERPQRECEQTMALRQALSAEGLHVSGFCPFGDVEQEVSDAAKNYGADLVVVGTHGRHGLERLVFGSHAEQLARTLHIPTLIVGPYVPSAPQSNWAPERILCVATPDEEGLQLVTFAAELAHTKNATLQVVCWGVKTSVAEKTDWINLMRGRIEKVQGHEANPNQVSRLQGEEAQSLIDAALKHRADLILLEGRHKFIDLASLFGRGTLPHLLAQAPCPVLVFPSQSD